MTERHFGNADYRIAKALASLGVQNALPKEMPCKFSDGDGLRLLVRPNCSKLLRFRYRFGGKEDMLAFGSFADISLASARTKRDKQRTLYSPASLQLAFLPLEPGKIPPIRVMLTRFQQNCAIIHSRRLGGETRAGSI